MTTSVITNPVDKNIARLRVARLRSLDSSSICLQEQQTGPRQQAKTAAVEEKPGVFLHRRIVGGTDGPPRVMGLIALCADVDLDGLTASILKLASAQLSAAPTGDAAIQPIF